MEWKKEDYFRRDEEKSDKDPPETYVVQRSIQLGDPIQQLPSLFSLSLSLQGILTILTSSVAKSLTYESTSWSHPTHR